MSRVRRLSPSSAISSAIAESPPWLRLAARRLLPRTIHLCTHCQHNPAGFWVTGAGDRTARRPWCLTCCQELDREWCDVIPFDSA